jgi:hypothetical protein
MVFKYALAIVEAIIGSVALAWCIPVGVTALAVTSIGLAASFPAW